ncbi:MAG: DUF1990 domain-containing protein [Magnetococcales bacterium]|nr:DUF1990 domain-containing protein [Magnetococcales bacterium]
MIRNPDKAMFSIIKPSAHKISSFIKSQINKPFTYDEVGISRDGPLQANHPLSKHYKLINRQFNIGEGEKSFELAKKAFIKWGMFDLEWVNVKSSTPMIENSLVGIVSHVMGVWSVNVCKIIYLVDEDGPIVRFGMGYGTLPGHAICGEERLSVAFCRETGSVSFEIFSFSTESQLIAKISSFHLRNLQDRFAKDSAQRMRYFAHL